MCICGEPLVRIKAMQKDFISGFSGFTKDETFFFIFKFELKNIQWFCTLKNLKFKVNAEINAKLKVHTHCTKIIKYFEYFQN